MGKIIEFPKKPTARVHEGRVIYMTNKPLSQLEVDIRLERIKESLKKINALLMQNDRFMVLWSHFACHINYCAA